MMASPTWESPDPLGPHDSVSSGQYSGQLSTSESIQLDRQLLCNICLERYDDPRILKCFHSFCRRCLVRVLGERSNDPDNPLPSYCPDHKRILDFFCDQCDCLMCATCAMKQPCGHELKEAQEVAVNLRSVFVNSLEIRFLRTNAAIDENIRMNEQFHEIAEEHRHKIRSTFQELRLTLNSRELSLVNAVDGIVKKKCTALHAQCDKLQWLRDTLLSRRDHLCRRLNIRNNDFSVLLQRKRIVEVGNTIIKEADQHDMVPVADIKDGPKCHLPEGLLQKVKSFGKIQCTPGKPVWLGDGLEEAFVGQEAISVVKTDDKRAFKGTNKAVPCLASSMYPPQPPVAYGLYRKCIYNGKEVHLHCKEHGIHMHFPQHDMEREVNVTVMSLKISSDECSLPNNAELVSGVYRICVSETLPSPVTIEMQHCVQLSNGDAASTMSFVLSDSEQDPPYQFKVLEGGQFTPNTCYGRIEISHFSNIAIVRFFRRLLRRTPPDLVYCTNVFRRLSVPGKYEVHIVVTKDLADHITYLKESSDYKGWILIAQQGVEFEDSIGVDIPEGEGKVSPKGWKIMIMQQPAKITKRSANKYGPGKCIPHIRLRIRWESEQESPVQDDLTMTLTGTKEPASFIIDCDPIPYTPSVSYDGVASPCSSFASPVSSLIFTNQPILEEQVDIMKLSLIKYNDGTGEKELRIKEQIAPQWRELATHLGFNPARIATLSQSHTPIDDMMMNWLQKDPQNCWKKLISKMHDAGLRTPAADLNHALCHILWPSH